MSNCTDEVIDYGNQTYNDLGNLKHDMYGSMQFEGETDVLLQNDNHS